MESKKFNRILQRKNRKGIRKIYEFYFPRIVLHINRTFRGVIDGEEIAQEFFIKLMKTEMKENIKYPTSWINTCCRNLAIDKLRKGNKTQFVSFNENDFITEFDEDGFIKSLTFADKLACLDKEAQIVIYLKFWEGYTYAEIAGILKMDIKEIVSIKLKAYTRLEKDLTDLKSEKRRY